MGINRDLDQHRAHAEPAAPAEQLLFFAEDGTRGRYAYVLVDGAARGTDVFFWDQATDRHRWVAASLAAYVDQRLDGTLPRAEPPP